MEKQERFYSVNKRFLFDKIEKQDDPETFHEIPNDYFNLLNPDTLEVLAVLDMGVTICFVKPEIFSMDEILEIVKSIKKYIS